MSKKPKGRGLGEKTKIKKEIKLLSKTAAAIEKAKKDLERKDFWKDLPGHIRKAALDMVSKIDPLEMAAVLGLTVLIKPQLPTLVIITEASTAIVIDWWKIWAWPLLGNPDSSQYDVEEIKKRIDAGDTDLGYWVLAFVLAFCFIRWGDKLLAAGISSIGNLVALFGLTKK